MISTQILQLPRHLSHSLTRTMRTLTQAELSTQLKVEACKLKSLELPEEKYAESLTSYADGQKISFRNSFPKTYREAFLRLHHALCAQEKKQTIPTIQKAINTANEDGSLQKDAIVLGPSSGSAICDLLKKGWRVTAINDHQESITQLFHRVFDENIPGFNEERIEATLGRIAGKVEGFRPVHPVSLVVAQDSLSYMQPDRMLAVLDKVDQCLVKDGIFTGNFFTQPLREKDAEIEQGTYGIWYATEEMVRSFAALKDYEILQMKVEDYYIAFSVRKK